MRVTTAIDETPPAAGTPRRDDEQNTRTSARGTAAPSERGAGAGVGLLAVGGRLTRRVRRRRRSGSRPLPLEQRHRGGHVRLEVEQGYELADPEDFKDRGIDVAEHHPPVMLARLPIQGEEAPQGG